MYIAPQDCCISTECPKYAICGRASRDGDQYNYYVMKWHEEWACTDGSHGSSDYYYCGEKGEWRMFLEKEGNNE